VASAEHRFLMQFQAVFPNEYGALTGEAATRGSPAGINSCPHMRLHDLFDPSVYGSDRAMLVLETGIAVVTAEMAFECLFVSRDPGLFSICCRVLRDLSIAMDVCLSASKAVVELGKGHTDLVVLDWESGDSPELMHTLQSGGKWRAPTVVAVSPSTFRFPGVHFVLNRPVTHASGASCLKGAYSKMLWDYRRHARHAVMMPVDALGEDGGRISLTVVNVGYGGVGLETKGKVVIGDVLSFQMSLPDAQRVMPVNVRVLWALESGRAGCEFVRLRPCDHIVLDDWLKANGRVKAPLVKV